MRSLKECYEIAKGFHFYWVDGNNAEYMCYAASDAFDYGELTQEELDAITEDAMSLVHAIDQDAHSLLEALDTKKDILTHEQVKAYWDKYIDNMENQDG